MIRSGVMSVLGALTAGVRGEGAGRGSWDGACRRRAGKSFQPSLLPTVGLQVPGCISGPPPLADARLQQGPLVQGSHLGETNPPKNVYQLSAGVDPGNS